MNVKNEFQRISLHPQNGLPLWMVNNPPLKLWNEEESISGNCAVDPVTCVEGNRKQVSQRRQAFTNRFLKVDNQVNGVHVELCSPIQVTSWRILSGSPPYLLVFINQPFCCSWGSEARFWDLFSQRGKCYEHFSLIRVFLGSPHSFILVVKTTGISVCRRIPELCVKSVKTPREWRFSWRHFLSLSVGEDDGKPDYQGQSILQMDER